MTTQDGDTAPLPSVAEAVGARRQGVSSESVPATPLARRLASDLGLSLHGIAGSGPFGRVQLADVQAREVRTPGVQPVPPGVAETDVPPASTAEPTVRQLIPDSHSQRIVGERRSSPAAAQGVLTCDVDITEGEKLCAQLSDEWSGGGLKLEPIHLVVRAAALALDQFPRMNSLRHRGEVAVQAVINIGLETPIDGETVIPVVHDCASSSLRVITSSCTELAARGRAGTLAQSDLSEATFTIATLDEGGADSLIPSTNPRHVAGLGVGAKRELPRYVESELVKRSMLAVCLTFDQHFVDTAYADRFLARLRQLLERPYLLFIDA